jgi:hypothetical protein
MIAKMEWRVSRRSMFPFLGLAVAFGLVVRPRGRRGPDSRHGAAPRARPTPL